MGERGGIAKSAEKVRAREQRTRRRTEHRPSSRSNDTYITSKVKSRMIEANKFPPNAVKVVTSGVVYLMGIVSMEEGAAAGETASQRQPASRVVKLFQYKT